MFQRRIRPNILLRLREFFWPSAGWHRSTRYVFHRVARIPGSSYSLSAGFACGAAISMTPFVGLHFVLSAVLAYIMRANILASAIGTAVGNPWTFPFIWVWIYNLGVWITGSDYLHSSGVDFATVFSHSMEALIRFDISYLIKTSGPVLWPMLIGSLPTAFVTWIIFYIPLQPMISRYQKARNHRRTAKRRERKKTKSSQHDLADKELEMIVSSDTIPETVAAEKLQS